MQANEEEKTISTMRPRGELRHADVPKSGEGKTYQIENFFRLSMRDKT
jgi:hypothetical protein